MKKAIVIFCCLAFIGLAFVNVGEFVSSAQRGVLLFGRNVMPILFPFFFVTSLLVELGFFSGFKRFGFTAPVFTLSLLGGYPTGARMLAELYTRGEISRTQAIRISTYTSTCSPIFVIATVGACFYKSTSIGITIFICHIIAAMINGLLYCKVRFQESENPLPLFGRVALKMPNINDSISNALYSAIQNIFAIGGLIVTFFVLANQIQVVISLNEEFNLAVAGILELTNGIHLASVTVPSYVLIPCAIVSFGGLAVAMQGFLFLKSFRMPFWFYLLYKGTHAIIAMLVCLLFVIP